MVTTTMRSGLFLCALLMVAVVAAAQPTRRDLDAYRERHPGALTDASVTGELHLSGIELARGEDAGSATSAFLASHHEIVPVDADDLTPDGEQRLWLEDDGSYRFTVRYYTQHVDGVRVLGAHLTLLVRNSAAAAVVLVRSTVVDPSSIRVDEPRPAVDLDVLSKAIPGLDVASVELLLAEDGDAYRYVIRALVVDDASPAVLEVVADPLSGAVRRARSQLYNADLNGTVEMVATPGALPDTISNQPTRVPVPDIHVRTDREEEATTDPDGSFTITDAPEGSATVHASVARSANDKAGRWVHVVNEGSEGTLTASSTGSPEQPAEIVLNTSPNPEGTAQANCFLHATKTRNFLFDVLPSYPGLDVPVQCVVNRSAFCDAHNANTKTTHFMRYGRAGNGCVNAAYQSVVQHEYGHIALWHAYDAAGRAAPTSRYHEGFADATATLLEDDPCLFPGFFAPGCTRSSNNTRSLPCTSSSPHFCGQVLSGAWWDLRQNLIATKGHTAALDLTRRLYLNAALLVPGDLSPTIVRDVLTLDDDDSNLENGTPHFNEIADAFTRHGLAPGFVPTPPTPTRTRGVRRSQ